MYRRIANGLLVLAIIVLLAQLARTHPVRAGLLEGDKTEACCFVDGSCLVLPLGSCLPSGGYPLGPGSTCDGANCVPGACCPVPGKELCIGGFLEQQCLDAGGQFQGSGSVCDDVMCLNPCPSDVDNDGTVGVLDFLQVLADWGPCP